MCEAGFPHGNNDSHEDRGPDQGRSDSQTPDGPVQIRLPMMCRCGEGRVLGADAMLASAREYIGNDEDLRFLSAAVYSLEHRFGAMITGIAADMWARVTVGTYDGATTVSCECDAVEDGLAAIITWFAANRTDQLHVEEPVGDMLAREPDQAEAHQDAVERGEPHAVAIDESTRMYPARKEPGDPQH